MILWKFLKYLKPYWIAETSIFFLMVIGTTTSLAFPYVMKIIIDDVFPNQNYELLMFMLAVLLGIAIVNILVSFFIQCLYAWVSNRVMRDMRCELFSHLINLPLAFHVEHDAGDIVHRINSEVNIIQSFISSSFLRFMQGLLTLFGLTIMLSWLNTQLFLISTILIPLAGINVWYFQPKIRAITEKARKISAAIMGFFMDRFKNIKMIQAYNGYEYENQLLDGKLRKQIHINMKEVLYSSSMNSISILVMSLSPILVFGWGGRQVILGAMSLGALVAFLQYLSRIFDPFKELNRLYLDFVRASVSMKRVCEFLDIPLHNQRVGGIQRINFRNKIIFKNVGFQHNDQVVLNEFNLELIRGKTYALVGASGCGKSTVVNLMCRFYEPSTGKICIDDIDIQQMDIHRLRDYIGFVSQDSMILNESLRENIRYGHLTCNLQNVESAIRLLDLENEIDIWERNRTSGSVASKLSGGQKQRIALARAVLKNAEILILDEATSALDSEKERRIFNVLRSYFRKKTLILVSHRFSTLKDVDEVICMDQGRIVEQGTPERLIRKKGHFWFLFRDQIEALESQSLVTID